MRRFLVSDKVWVDVELRDAAEQVYMALVDKGKYPSYHDLQAANLQRHWNTLWRALVRLCEVVEGEDP